MGKAASRGATKDKPWTPHGDHPTTSVILDHIQHNSFEQTMMTIMTCLALSVTLPKGVDLRLPVAWAYTYIFGRAVFIIGYLKATRDSSKDYMRLPGLFLGGFWQNLAALVYATLASAYLVRATTELAVWIYLGTPLAIILMIAIGLSTCGKSARAREIP